MSPTFQGTDKATIEGYALDIFIETATDLLVGVLLPSATLSNGIKILDSGKYVATFPTGIS